MPSAAGSASASASPAPWPCIPSSSCATSLSQPWMSPSILTQRPCSRRSPAPTQIAFLNQETGEPIGPRTHQSYAGISPWARGRTWAVYGFALAAEWCQEPRFLEAPQRAARGFMAELLPDGVPWGDLHPPKDAPHCFDSSAGAIAADGMLRLARW